MSRIRGKDTMPEKVVRSLLHRMGYRFRLHVRIPIPPSTLNSQPRTFFVRPDILLPKYKTAIFVHGCFWHRHKGCKNCTTPTNQRNWWIAKLNGNVTRDKLHQKVLRKLGFRVMVIWECETDRDKSVPFTMERLRKILRASQSHAGTASRTGLALAGGNSFPARSNCSVSFCTTVQTV
jgi:DNA mismatch endonuclease, patch repair protein